MPKTSPIQTDFSGGELGPLVEGRVDIEKHKTGSELIENYIPLLEGPLIRRPGSKRVGAVKDPSKPPKFIPFKFSNTEQYILEFGDKYVRFFTDESQVVTTGSTWVVSAVNSFQKNYQGTLIGQDPFYATRSVRRLYSFERDAVVANTFSSVVQGTILELPTFYDNNMVQNLGYAQKGNTLWLFHSSIPTFTLTRFTLQDWELKRFRHKDGPYLPLNTNRALGDGSNAKIRINPVAGSNGKTFDWVTVAAHSSSLIANVIDDGNGEAQVFVTSNHGFYDGQDVYITGARMSAMDINNTGNFNQNIEDTSGVDAMSSRWTIKVINASSFVLRGTAFAGVYQGSGLVTPAIWHQTDAGRNFAFYLSNGHRYYGYLSTNSSITGAASGAPSPVFSSMTVDPDHPITVGQIAGTTIAEVWQLGAFGKPNGWPSSGTFHQNRLVMASVPGRPAEFYASNTNDFEMFKVNDASTLSVVATHSLQFDLETDSQEFIQWVKAGRLGLYFGSTESELLVSPSRDGEALTPTNINKDIIGSYGTAKVNPVRFGDSIIYVQNSQRKIRELRYFANLNSHKSTQINSVSDHITLPGISGLTTQKESVALIWGYRTDGKMVSMSYSRDDSQVVSGWAQHYLGGRSDSSGTAPVVKAMETIKDSTGKYDQIWMAVQRYINGTSIMTVEYLTEPFRHKDPNQKQRDAFYVDCGATYDSSLIISSITFGSCLVTVSNHGLLRNDLVMVDDVVGLNSSLINADGVLVSSNLVNAKVFVVGSTTANTFFLQDFNSSIVVNNTYTPYFSGGKVRKLVSTVGGLTWLKNEEVDILADGGYMGTAIVDSAGVVALTNPAAVVQIGYGYKSRLKTLVKDNGSATGSAIGMERKTYKIAIKARDIGDLRFSGMSFLSMHEANFGIGDEITASGAVPLFTGIYKDGIEQDVSLYGQVFLEQRSPLPGMIQSITYMMDEYDE